MRYRALFVAWLGMIFILAPSEAPAANWEQMLQKLYPAAQREGEVIFNTERIEEVGGEEGIAQFKKRFPGIKVTFTGIAGSIIASRVINEAKSGRVTIDAFRSEPARAEPLASRGLLLEINPKEFTDRPIMTFYNNKFFKIGDHITNFAYNTALVAKADRPKRYEDLLDPKWKRKLVLDARGGQIAHLLAFGIWSEERFWKFIKGLKEQQPVWAVRSTDSMVKLAAGEGHVGNGSYGGIEESREKGAPVEFLFLSPANSQVRGVSIIKGSPHPNAATLFLGWVLSPEGVQAMDKHAIGLIAPGTVLYQRVKESGAEITFDDSMEKINKRFEVEEKITKEWGVVKVK